MSDYFPPLRHMQFLLNEVFEAPKLWAAIESFTGSYKHDFSSVDVKNIRKKWAH